MDKEEISQAKLIYLKWMHATFLVLSPLRRRENSSTLQEQTHSSEINDQVITTSNLL